VIGQPSSEVEELAVIQPYSMRMPAARQCLVTMPASRSFEQFAGLPAVLAAAFLTIALFTASMAFAQPSEKAEEVSRETKQEIEAILSDIQKRGPSPAVEPRTPDILAPTMPAGPVESRIAWRRLLAFSVVLVVLGVLGFIVLKALRTSPMRGLAAGLIGVGLLAAIVAVPIAEMWTERNASAFYQREVDILSRTGNMQRASLLLELVREGKIHMAVSPLPGVFGGLGVAALGVIVLALDVTRRPA
jgi:hypothetical protein